jgi:hypothetical protein
MREQRTLDDKVDHAADKIAAATREAVPPFDPKNATAHEQKS